MTRKLVAVMRNYGVAGDALHSGVNAAVHQTVVTNMASERGVNTTTWFLGQLHDLEERSSNSDPETDYID